jgi:hypothetical protein
MLVDELTTNDVAAVPPALVGEKEVMVGSGIASPI